MSKPEESEHKQQRGRSGTQEHQAEEQASRWAEQYQSGRPKTQVDLNEASLEDLEKITGIGRERARDLIEHRPFQSWEDVEKVPGFSQGMVADLKNSGATLGEERGHQSKQGKQSQQSQQSQQSHRGRKSEKKGEE